MITPQFSVRQDDKHVYIDIKAPYIKAADVEFVVDNEMFIFSLHPYYLRLRFPGKLHEDTDEEEDNGENKSKASYDVSTSMVNVRVPKETPGEEFKDLDMLAKLLARKDEDTTQPKSAPLIQELSEGINEEAIRQAEQFDWEIEQQVPAPLGEENITVGTVKYGFDDQYYGRDIEVSLLSGNDLNELENPERDTVQQRISQRVASEDAQFDEERYLCDLMEPEEYVTEVLSTPLPPLPTEFSSEVREKMLQLPRKSYALVSSPKTIYVNLVGLLFAYCYDYRTTLGDPTVESAWTIGKICPLINNLDSHFTTLKPLVITCTRRSLAYPLFRSWDLSIKVWDDVRDLLEKSASNMKVLVNVLVSLVKLFETGDRPYHVYNRIWMLDYASWAQSASPAVIKSLADELRKTEIQKSDLGWDLDELDQAARDVAAQAPDSDDES